ncbi:MAG: hypothetical protein K2Y23_12530 [Cyanobacteria bacterium]|nr:hypothetical protein [Cyanobacteriota bacterium]
MLSTGFIVHFAPETWSFGYRFNKFMGPPFHVDSALCAGVASVLAHQDKYSLLVDIANAFRSTLDEDETELEETGYTAARRTRSFAALSETMVAEQYAMLDGFRKVVHSIFRRVPGTQDSSTQKLFKRAADATYGAVPASHVGAHIFPELNARLAAAQADWFPLLCQVRTLTTHGRTGNCYRDRDTGRISYRYRTGAEKDVHIEDIVAWLNDTFGSVCGLMEWFFEQCFDTLEAVERPVLCGIYNERIYERFVAATATLSADDGRCLSRGWFDTEPGCECPKRGACGAYNRPVPKEEREVHYAEKKRMPADVAVQEL